MKAKKILLIPFLCLLFIQVYSQKEGDWNPINPPNSPEARHGHSMVTLPDGRVMLFGGEGPQADLFNDLYAYDNNDWGEIIPDNEPPAARRDHQAWMEGDQMCVFGGYGGSGPLNDMWSYDINTNEWIEHFLSGTIPPPRKGHSTFTSANGTRYVLGGMDSEGNKLRDFYQINADNSCSRLSDAPRTYYRHIAHLVDDDLVLVFGKSGLIGIYQISVSVWGETPGGFTLDEFNTYVVSDELIVGLGGIDENGNISNKVQVLNTTTGEITTRTISLPAYIENGSGAKYYGNKNQDDYQVLLFGGIVNGEISNATYISTNNLLSIDEADSDIDYNIKISLNRENESLGISASRKIEKIQFYDLSGNLIRETDPYQSIVSLNIHSIETGIYIILLKIEGRIISRKMVLN